METITPGAPNISTAHIPHDMLANSDLGRAVARLDNISLEEVGSIEHQQAVRQVILDAQVAGISVLSQQDNQSSK